MKLWSVRLSDEERRLRCGESYLLHDHDFSLQAFEDGWVVVDILKGLDGYYLLAADALKHISESSRADLL